MIVVHFGFGMSGPWGEEMSNTLDGLAHDINNTEGLVWKIWTENEKEGDVLVGSICLRMSNPPKTTYPCTAPV